MEQKIKQCDKCKSEVNYSDINLIQDKWICGNCKEKDFRAKYELEAGHNGEEFAILIKNYPYGFKLKTDIKFWIETTKNGDRFCSQNLNPKNNKWNAVKKSTYSDLAVLVREKSTGHISWRGWSVAYSEPLALDRFLEFADGQVFNKNQLEKIVRGRAIYKTREYINFEIVNTTNMTQEEKQKNEEEQKQIKQNINKIFSHELAQAKKSI